MNRSVPPLFVRACFAFCECCAALHVSCRVQTMCPLFVVGQQLFHSISKVNFCRLLLNLKGKQMQSSSLITPIHTYSIIWGSPLKWPVLGARFDCLISLSKVYPKDLAKDWYPLCTLIKTFKDMLVLCWGLKETQDWVPVTFKFHYGDITVFCVDYPYNATVSFTLNCLALTVFICQLSFFYVWWIIWGSCTFL